MAAGRVPLGRFLLAQPPRLAAGAVVAPGASVGEAVVLGPGCRVPAGARVERAVLWPGTSLRPGEVLEEAIAAGELRVTAGGG